MVIRTCRPPFRLAYLVDHRCRFCGAQGEGQLQPINNLWTIISLFEIQHSYCISGSYPPLMSLRREIDSFGSVLLVDQEFDGELGATVWDAV